MTLTTYVPVEDDEPWQGESVATSTAAMKWWAERLTLPGACVPSLFCEIEGSDALIAVCERCGQVITSGLTRYCANSS